MLMGCLRPLKEDWVCCFQRGCWSWPDSSVEKVPAAVADSRSWTRGTHGVQGENWLLQVILWPPHLSHGRSLTWKIKEKLLNSITFLFLETGFFLSSPGYAGTLSLDQRQALNLEQNKFNMWDAKNSHSNLHPQIFAGMTVHILWEWQQTLSEMTAHTLRIISGHVHRNAGLQCYYLINATV